MALDQVRRARALGVQFGWVLADAGYGKAPEFLFALHEMGECFPVDVHKDFVAYKDDPRPHVPRKVASRGRSPTRAKSTSGAYEVRELVSKLPESSWQTKTLRPST
jgi:SRSO17 transposase